MTSPISPPLEIDLAPLRSAVAGDVTGPGDDGYDGARGAWNLVADQRPAAVVHAASADDVAAVVRFAAEHGLKVAPQATGHGAVALPPLGDAILLRTERLAGLSDRPRGPDRPRGARRQVGPGRRRRGRARPRRPRRLLPDRRRHGLHARRRPRLAGP